MNVLITCVGRRSYMVDYFRNALNGEGLVFAANCDGLSTGMLRADKSFIVPLVHDANYIDSLLEICEQENVALLLSLFDMDLPYLANARQQFKAIGTEVIVSDPWVIETSADKWLTYLFLRAQGLITPLTFSTLLDAEEALTRGALRFPLILKPRLGMASMFIYIVHTLSELRVLHEYSAKLISESLLQDCVGFNCHAPIIIQQFIEGEAIAMDVFNDLHGKHLMTVSKLKLRVWAGETDRAKVIVDDDLTQIGLELSTSLRHRGNLDVDLIIDSTTGQTNIIEMNPRFGGAYPFSHLAGVDFPNALLQMIKGEKPVTGVAVAGLIGMKEIVPISLGPGVVRDSF